MKERLCAYEGCTRGDGGTRNNFIPKGRHTKTKYCCIACYGDDRRGKPIDPAVVQHRRPRTYTITVKYGWCLHCDKKFEIKHKGQKFCSLLHASRYNGKKRADDARKARKSSLVMTAPKKLPLAV